MSETSSDTESSCGWTIISNEGSDIETLGSEAVVEYGAELSERPRLEKAELQEGQPSASAAECIEEGAADSLDDTLREQTIDETLYAPEAGGNTPGKEHVTVLSSSDHSDIVTLRDSKEEGHAEVEEEAEANEEFYMGTSCSSQYAFTATETVFPVQKSAVTNSSSSEDEAKRSPSPVVRRRRLRKNTTSAVTEPEDEEEEEGVQESGHSEEEEEEVREQKQQEVHTEVRPVSAQDVRVRGQGSSILNKCILIALVVAISMGYGHFYGTVQIQERQKTVEKIRVNEMEGVRDLLQQHMKDQPLTKQVQRGDFSLDDPGEQKVISLLTEVIEKIRMENQELSAQQAQAQAQRDDLEMLLKQKADERTTSVSQQQRLLAENQLLKNSLEREEKSLYALQQELRNLRSKIREMEVTGAAADSLLTENQRLKDQLEEEKRLIRSQREDMMLEAQTMKKRLDKERKVTDELRRELNLLRSRISEAEKDSGSEAEELQSRLMELEKRLSFEQQRSDLWERLYVETKEDRAKGDTETKVKKPKHGMAVKVKETFDAVKNSTKEFVHHHKEQIKKAKEAVKENLRKFSDSVKLTFRHFKDSASTFINKARNFYDKRREEQHKFKPHHRHSHKFDDSFQSNHNTRKPGDKVHTDQQQNTHKSTYKGCSGVFDCAYQESMSLFNRATEPIRADEFYQLMQSYLQQEVDHFHHWKELEMFINNFFHNGVFIHDRMLFTDFVSGVEDYLTDMHEYHGLDDDVFEDLDDYVYRHFFGEAYTKSYGPK
ncbi:cell cycle progression protein 1 isoform X2 [Halichoeres trimaculatus]|uniref:cell cycle progression protein 1 isoform X2 n=1 Tax=Halichoeres trimaculatus TaxID=147232 RepID=UPI003D9E67EB